MARKKALEQWETKVRNFEVTPQAVWPIAKSVMKRDGPNTSNSVHGPSKITYHTNEKANLNADCLETQFNRIEDILASSDGTPLGKVRPCDIQIH
jgi:hypothetical protein